ncbi:TetR family transcriptional regulator [Brucella anthropi]|jgi:TetR/AcrR family transcriptional regulator, acrAB operon repressor|uniref:Transcriptional regulator, TetR family n=3 Tax=Brucella TaxID=234 RepID=A6WVV1_BRUA4|nr:MULTISPECIES: TetR family transcriptional regulator [Brucella/Ochrobactrum group]QOD63906.1 TetR family transcriptional regulator [Ochrobactrum sp. MT180101]QTN01953.1 TetR family transcriptional regulator [Ochrobactrum sp. EEELCW01]RNL42471.1 TetR family transcriptional regulator [Ochrobactrum sp. MH181795]ABS13105.1 transcriptional regulator, TetR family [Brucella anthropi ATCC 49188]EXL07285.1 TetR family transcriptional regulator [Brucella anthropi]
MRRTKAEAAETREAILVAAEQVFLERGVNQSTLMEIACHAGVTRGAIYFHFHDKLEIARTIIGNVRFPQEEIMLQAAAVNHPNPMHVLEQSIIQALHLFSNDVRQQNIFIIINQRCEFVGEMAPLEDRLREARSNVLSLLAGLLDVAARRGELSKEWTADTAALILLSMLSGLLNEWLRGDRNYDLVTYGGKAISILIRSLRNQEFEAHQTQDYT